MKPSKHFGKYRVCLPYRFVAKFRYFENESDARAQANAIFQATGIIVAIERINK
jgi:hypothetical protein